MGPLFFVNLAALAFLSSVQAGTSLSRRKKQFRRAGLGLCILLGSLAFGTPLMGRLAGQYWFLCAAAVLTAVSVEVSTDPQGIGRMLKKLIPAALPGLAASGFIVIMHCYLGGVGRYESQWAVLLWMFAGICLPRPVKIGRLSLRSYKALLPVEHREAGDNPNLFADGSCAASDSMASAVPPLMYALGGVITGLCVDGLVSSKFGFNPAFIMVFLPVWGLVWTLAASRFTRSGLVRQSLGILTAAGALWLAGSCIELHMWSFCGGVAVFLIELACSLLIVRLFRVPWEVMPLFFLVLLGQPLLSVAIPLLKGERSLAALQVSLMPVLAVLMFFVR